MKHPNPQAGGRSGLSPIRKGSERTLGEERATSRQSGASTGSKMGSSKKSPQRHQRGSTSNAKDLNWMGKSSEGADPPNEYEGGAIYVEKYSRKYPDKEMSYTDKDRAAAVAMGTRDIKVSLQVKKKREKKQDEPGEREFQIRTSLVEKELRSSNPNRALQFINKAMEFRPNSKECFVSRSKCYLMMGQTDAALADAETSMKIDKTYIKAVFAKAEALYALGDFEHALMYYHRGFQLRPELEEFRLGIQKAEEAIENVIGDNTVIEYPASELKLDLSRHQSNAHPPEDARVRSVSVMSIRSERSAGRSTPASDRINSASFLDLRADIDFINGILNNSELSDMAPSNRDVIERQAREALDFLETRQEFWTQQRPRSVNPSSSLQNIPRPSDISD